MPRVDKFQMSLRIHRAKKHRRVTPHLSVIAEIAINVVKDARRFRSERQTGERALQHRRQHRRAQSFSGYVRDQKCRPSVAHRENVKIITSDRETRKIAAAYVQLGKVFEAAWQKRLLNVARDIDFLF